MKNHILTVMLMAVVGFFPAAAVAQSQLPDASPANLQHWRGFNLDPFWKLDLQRPVDEADFQIVKDLGFNFVRFPMDYRIWIENGDWHVINEMALAEVDRAVAFGGEYDIHVQLNFHRAPGYTVTQPPEPASLWTSEEAQQVCAMHWATFARRYKGIPNSRLSFNLLNEPGNIDPALYASVIGQLVSAIRAEDPDRLIIVDGLAYGTSPVNELVPLNVAQATRGYSPMEITHYGAIWAWTNNTPRFGPVWPMVRVSSYLYSPTRSENTGPLDLVGSFPAGTKVLLGVGVVSNRANLAVSADGRSLFQKNYVSGPEPVEGETIYFDTNNSVWRADYSALPANEIVLDSAATGIRIENTGGDWLAISSLAVQLPGGEVQSLPLLAVWGSTSATCRQVAYSPAPADNPWSGSVQYDPEWLWQGTLARWKTFSDQQGVGVMVGEWGCYNRTPYETTLRWMEDCLINFQRAGCSWALWNLSGPFGILDSERPDAVYELYRGHLLDRRMLELLQRY